MEFNLRLAQPEELPEVWRLYTDAVRLLLNQGIYQWDEIYPNRDTIASDIQNQQMYLLTQEHHILAAAVLNEEQDERYRGGNWKYATGRTAVIHRLCVKAPEQKKGLGRKTMLLAERELLRQDYGSVRLDAFSENPYSLKLYVSLGYEKTGEVTFRKGRFFLFEKPLHTGIESKITAGSCYEEETSVKKNPD